MFIPHWKEVRGSLSQWRVRNKRFVGKSEVLRNQPRFAAPSPAKMHAMRLLMTIALSLSFGASVEAQWWRVQTSGTDTNLRGVTVAEMADPKAVPVPVPYASGSNGMILKSIDE